MHLHNAIPSLSLSLSCRLTFSIQFRSFQSMCVTLIQCICVVFFSFLVFFTAFCVVFTRGVLFFRQWYVAVAVAVVFVVLCVMFFSVHILRMFKCVCQCVYVNWLNWHFCLWIYCCCICVWLLMYINNCIDRHPAIISFSFSLAYQWLYITMAKKRNIQFISGQMVYLHYRINPCNNLHFFAWCVHLCSNVLVILLSVNIVGILFGFPWIWSVWLLVVWLKPVRNKLCI